MTDSDKIEFLMDESDIVVNRNSGEEVDYEVFCTIEDGIDPVVGFTAFPDDMELSPEDGMKFWMQLGKALKLAGKVRGFKITIEVEEEDEEEEDEEEEEEEEEEYEEEEKEDEETEEEDEEEPKKEYGIDDDIPEEDW